MVYFDETDYWSGATGPQQSDAAWPDHFWSGVARTRLWGGLPTAPLR